MLSCLPWLFSCSTTNSAPGLASTVSAGSTGSSSGVLVTMGVIGCLVPARPGSRHATSERLVACASGRARLLWCKMRLPARPAGNVGIERFCRARPARCRLGCARCIRGESSGARTTRAPRQPNSFPAWPCCMRPGNQTVSNCMAAAWPRRAWLGRCDAGWGMR
jgi:hypothetical protein